MTLEESIAEADKLQNLENLRFIYDTSASKYLENASITYSDRWWNKGLRVHGFGGSSCS